MHEEGKQPTAEPTTEPEARQAMPTPTTAGAPDAAEHGAEPAGGEKVIPRNNATHTRQSDEKRRTHMRSMEDIRSEVATALKRADTEALEKLSEEAEPEERYNRVEVGIERMKGWARTTSATCPDQPTIEVETGVVEALALDIRMNEGRSIDRRSIAAVIRELNRVGDIATLERVRDAIDLALARYAGELKWCVPTRDDDGTLIWQSQSISRDVPGNGAPAIRTAVEVVGRMMAASPELKEAFERHAARGETFLADHAWGRAAREGLRSRRTADVDRELCDEARRTARRWRKLIEQPPESRKRAGADERFDERSFDAEGAMRMNDEDNHWADILVGAGIAGDASLTRQLCAAGVGAIRITNIDRGAGLGERPRAQVTIERHSLESCDSVLAGKRFAYWTSWEEAVELATEELDEDIGDALEVAMTQAPEKVGAKLRKALGKGKPGSRRRSMDGLVELFVPTAGEEAWTEARRSIESARRAMQAQPASTTRALHELRQRWAGHGNSGPEEVLARMQAAIEWGNRYSVRRMLLALMPEPDGGTVISGAPRLAAHEGRRDGRITTTLESPAWAAHGLPTPEGSMAVSDALTLAGQTGTRLDRATVQAAIDQLVWAGNEKEIDRCAACLACQPGLVNGNEDEPVDFGRMQTRDSVKLYER